MSERPQKSAEVLRVEPSTPFQPFADTVSFNKVDLRNASVFAEFTEHVLKQEIELSGIHGTIFISPVAPDEVTHMESTTPMGKVREVVSYNPKVVIEEYPVILWTEFDIKTMEQFFQLKKTAMIVNPSDGRSSFRMDCHSDYIDSLNSLNRTLQEEKTETLQNYYIKRGSKQLIALLPMDLEKLRQLEFVFAENNTKET